MNSHSPIAENQTSDKEAASVTVSTRLPRWLYRQVREKAARHRVSDAWVVREAVRAMFGEERKAF